MRKALIIFFCLPIIGLSQQSRGYEKRPLNVPIGITNKNNPVVIQNVPPFLWHRGCGPTALGMIVGYYDLQSYDNLFPDSSLDQSNEINLLIASEEHYSDYSRPKDYYPDLIQDLSELGNPHQSNSIADFMNTSKSINGNYWGWSWSSDIGTAFEQYVEFRDPSYITNTEYEYFSSDSWNEYKAEIDNNRPVIILVDTDADGETDHFVVGIGYDDINQEYACYDTWDSNIHWYEWQEINNGVYWGVYGFNKFQIEKTVSSCGNIYKEFKGGYQVVDALGRKAQAPKNKLLFYIYDNGEVQKRIIVE